MQLSIGYTKIDGIVCILIDTKILEITNNLKEVLNKDTDYTVLEKNCKLFVCSYAKNGKYRKAVDYAKTWVKFMKKHSLFRLQMRISHTLDQSLSPIVKH